MGPTKKRGFPAKEWILEEWSASTWAALRRSLGQAKWLHFPRNEGCLCMEGWPAYSQLWAAAHASEVGVSMHWCLCSCPALLA